MKILIIKLKKLVLSCQHKLHMKPTTSLYCIIQQCQVHWIFVFYVFYWDLKEKHHIRRNINCKKRKNLYVKSVLLLFWFAKNWGWLGLYNKKLNCLCLTAQNTLNQSDCRILWSSIYLEGINIYLRFFAWR